MRQTAGRMGVDGESLQPAPMLRFDRRDDLQSRWVREAWDMTIAPPSHWAPSTQGMHVLKWRGPAYPGMPA